MYMRGRGLGLTVVSVVVVLALTGCGDSGQDHGGSKPGGSARPSSSPSSSPSGGGSQPTPTVSPSRSKAPPLKDGTAVLVRCASTEDPYATVEIRNPNGRDAVLNLSVSFADANGFVLMTAGGQISVPAKDTWTYRVPAKSPHLDKIVQCDVDPVAKAAWAT
ncbi:hypothetical protein [Streptomyces edwardsiae]|uniref:Secreted protein n=1 Tax=Streptomyces edwardsiae TaxID=3075527 RepID=A0ABU2PYI1_9ACTN|nr:hypothetical protein [Streptomyces sp. DSM 41636]MDT0397227.1 hypothetical protein [Streptomyces sp. DSM 41636]